MASLHVLILAAGEGKRMHSSQPKVLHPCAGAPLVAHVVRAARELDADSIHVVVPPENEAFRSALDPYDVAYAVQETPEGTAHALAAGCAAIGADSGRLLVINGDCPGVLPATLSYFVDEASDDDAALLTVIPDDPGGYGRIVRDEDGHLVRIVEEIDASADELLIAEVNGGIYCFDLEALPAALAAATADNAQRQSYITDVVGALRQAPGGARAVPYDDGEEVHGVNSRAELARAEALLRARAVDALMESGVTVRDPGATYVDVDVEVGADTILYPGVVLEAGTKVGSGCTVYPGVRVKRSSIGDRVTLFDGSVIEDSSIDDDANIGPYARLRPGSEIGPRTKVGNFVETKATRLGAGSKAGHLTYLGDAVIGENVNIGAGTITCNYDGVEKHETVVGDGAFIGSNTELVAPVRVGANAYIGAGSTITEDVPDGALGLGRGRQVIKENWVAKKDPDEEE